MIPQKDFMIRGVLKEYAIRFAFGSFKTLAQTGILRHDTDPAAARLLAGALCSGALISVLLDDEERYSVRLTYPGPVKGMILDISAQNGLRGFIQNPHVMTETHDLDTACGSGCTVALTKSKNGKILNSGQTESAFIEPEAALSYFFSVSDQIETEIRSEIRFRPDPAAPVECAAAVMLQALPECDLDVFNKIRERLMDDASGAVLAETGVPPEEQLKKLFEYLLCKDAPALDAHETTTPQFVCSCSAEKLWETAKVMLGDDDFAKLLAENPDPVIRCQFCNTEHHLPRS